MARKVAVRNHKRVSVCLSEDQLDKVEKMAIKLSQEAVLKIPAEKWLQCQMERRLWQERRRRENAV